MINSRFLDSILLQKFNDWAQKFGLEILGLLL